MSEAANKIWRVRDHLIEQPSWGGRYIVELKGMEHDSEWAGKKVGQSYELAKESVLIDVDDGSEVALAAAISADPAAFLGAKVSETHGREMSLLIKLTQAKGNSFQVHLPEGKRLGHWKPKPEAWFYLAPGLYTFGLKAGTSFEAYSCVLNTLDDDMQRLSEEVKSGRRTVENAREQAQERIQKIEPYAYVNLVHAEADDVIDLTAGGIHHSWEDDETQYPDGNLVYEVQIDVPDELCSMRGFDKGKILDDGSLRATHVNDYLSTIEQDPAHNELSRHIGKPQPLSDTDGAATESIFRTPYFAMDRLILEPGATANLSVSDGFHHLFVHEGRAQIGDVTLEQGRSYMVPAGIGDYQLLTQDVEAVVFKTFLPVE